MYQAQHARVPFFPRYAEGDGHQTFRAMVNPRPLAVTRELEKAGSWRIPLKEESIGAPIYESVLVTSSLLKGHQEWQKRRKDQHSRGFSRRLESPL